MSQNKDKDKAVIGLWVLSIMVAIAVSIMARQGLIDREDAREIRDAALDAPALSVSAPTTSPVTAP